MGGANYMDILDFNYISISVEEVSNCYYGTNSNINKSIALMFPLSVIYKAENTPKHVEFIDKGRLVKEFKPTPLNCFDNLKFTISDSNGNPLRFKNDILTINQIQKVDGSNFLTINMNERFNGEYQNGDLIKIKNFTTITGINSKLVNFLNREEGHIIYIDTTDKFENTSDGNIFQLKNSFKILLDGDYNDSGVFVKSDYIPNTLDLGNVTGTILNTNLQFTMFLKVETKVMEFENLNAEII